LNDFEINQEDSKKTIEKSYFRIEIQNKELEIINTELEKLSIVASRKRTTVSPFTIIMEGWNGVIRVLSDFINRI